MHFMKSIKNVFGIIGLSIVTMLFAQTTSTHGASVTVLVGSGGLRFVPATANIPVNDSVIWSWAGSFHSSTSGTPPGTPNGLWDSGVNNLPHSFTNTFTTAGNFPYFCSIHFGSGMVGNIIVTNPAVPRVWHCPQCARLVESRRQRVRRQRQHRQRRVFPGRNLAG